MLFPSPEEADRGRGWPVNGATAPAATGTGPEPAGMIGNDLLRLENLTHRYRAPRRQKVHAVENLSLTVAPGEALGLVGESGCGKSTVARCAIGLIRPTAGRIIFDGTDVWAQPAKWRRADLRPASSDRIPRPHLQPQPPPQGTGHPGRPAHNPRHRRQRNPKRTRTGTARHGAPPPRRRRQAT